MGGDRRDGTLVVCARCALLPIFDVKVKGPVDERCPAMRVGSARTSGGTMKGWQTTDVWSKEELASTADSAGKRVLSSREDRLVERRWTRSGQDAQRSRAPEDGI